MFKNTNVIPILIKANTSNFDIYLERIAVTINSVFGPNRIVATKVEMELLEEVVFLKKTAGQFDRQFFSNEKRWCVPIVSKLAGDWSTACHSEAQIWRICGIFLHDLVGDDVNWRLLAPIARPVAIQGFPLVWT